MRARATPRSSPCVDDDAHVESRVGERSRATGARPRRRRVAVAVDDLPAVLPQHGRAARRVALDRMRAVRPGPAANPPRHARRPAAGRRARARSTSASRGRRRPVPSACVSRTEPVLAVELGQRLAERRRDRQPIARAARAARRRWPRPSRRRVARRPAPRARTARRPPAGRRRARAEGAGVRAGGEQHRRDDRDGRADGCSNRGRRREAARRLRDRPVTACGGARSRAAPDGRAWP